MIPSGAKEEADLGEGVVLLDVSHLLPVDMPESRDASKINRCYHHHSGALGQDGYNGAHASSRYVVGTRGFPSAAYTYWLSFEPDVMRNGQIVVYRLNADDVRSWHTGGDANTYGISVAWQGNLSTRAPSPYQYHAARMLCRWLMTRHSLDSEVPFSYHSESNLYGGSGKKACPGPFVERWVEDFRRLATVKVA